MRHRLLNRIRFKIAAGLLASLGFVAARGGVFPTTWQQVQSFEVNSPGLIKIALPVSTLDLVRPGFEDLRLYDGQGTEQPYLLQRPRPMVGGVRGVRTFQASLSASTTIILMATGVTQPIDGVLLTTPERSFLKPVRVEGSTDGKSWRVLAEDVPIFHQPNGVGQTFVELPKAVWQWLRVTVHDKRTAPISFTTGEVHLAEPEPVPLETLPVKIVERHENPGQTRLTLDLGAANLDLSRIRIEASDTLFARRVRLAVPRMVNGEIREQPVGEGAIYRVAVEGQPPVAGLTVPVNGPIGSRELIVFVQNDDSPPLDITSVAAEVHPIHLLFNARAPGTYYFLTGNEGCAAPRYDLVSLESQLKEVAPAIVTISPAAPNPDYRPAEVLAGVQEGATRLDVAAWSARKRVNVEQPGAAQIELDLDVLAGAQAGFGDLRLIQTGEQRPYVLERTSITRPVPLSATAGTDPKDPQLSRWTIKLPRAGLPFQRITFATTTPVFQREFLLYEENTDEHGEKSRRQLGSGRWVRTPEQAGKQFTITLDGTATGDTVFLETRNGDNPPIQLQEFQTYHPVTRILFKARPGDELSLYYGNAEAAAPCYDLSLVANQLLSARKITATLGAEERLKVQAKRNAPPVASGGVIFWAALALVVVVLLFVMARLLPKPPPAGGDSK